MNDGFYTALGTPLDEQGQILSKSYTNQINQQITAGAAGLLCMGSMGNMIGIREKDYVTVALEGVKANQKRVPLMIGVMDNSISRVMDRVEAISHLDFDGIVATTPFYYVVNQSQIISFYTSIANQSKKPLYLYDLPGVTQSPISVDSVLNLMKHENIKGIKSGNMNLISALMRHPYMQDDFDLLFSGLDTFDIALQGGIKKNLDGMFCCTPNNTNKMYQGDNPFYYLKNILGLRNIFIKHGVLASFSYSMELLGLPGRYHEDYSQNINNQAKEEIKAFMDSIGEETK
ncbi:MAG: dihydrodipicolinate synthase family protein [Clostridiales bacterium]|nr:dihydrodipicolinate synthase family protein [Clostridiales bacterium]